MGDIRELPANTVDFPVRLCAELGPEWKSAVEDLLFFNPQQALVERQILQTIHAFGLPRVLISGQSLRIVVGKSLIVGTLFAMVRQNDREQLAGLVLFLRHGTDMICLHLSVDEMYTQRGIHSKMEIAARLLDEVRRIGIRIAGVDYLGIYYKRNGWYKIPLATKFR